MNTKNHWDNVYQTKNPDQVSWTQDIPKTSLEFIDSFKLKKNAKIIDVGGGDSKLVDHLLNLGYVNITVLDISEKSIEKAKTRLGNKAKLVTWIVSNVIDFEPNTTFDVWHDRAAFHFLTNTTDINKYRKITQKFVDGFLVVSTFSTEGPTKCSGLEIKQYNVAHLREVFEGDFSLIRSKTENHETPFNTNQNFLFCGFKKIKAGQ